MHPLSRIIFLMIALLPWHLQAEQVVWHRSPLDFGNNRYVYDIELLRLALEKTRPAYGDYQLLGLPATNYARLLHSLIQNTHPNLILEISYDKKLVESQGLTFINFPIDLGIIGYRVCFVNPAIKEKIKQVQTLDELRKYSIGQGVGWADIAILRHNGFNVVEVSSYVSLFKMVAGGRFDLFCRGANELMEEFEQYKEIGKLTYDESFALVYRMPRFFYLNGNNPLLKKRIEEGLHIAYNDGSLLELWRKENQLSIDFAKMRGRKIFYLENPMIRGLSEDYARYFVDPLALPDQPLTPGTKPDNQLPDSAH